jgi:ribosomal protein S12 methylthiotransferase
MRRGTRVWRLLVISRIKVAEGCDYKCSFCIIPTLRGHYRSRPVDAIVREAQSLAARGVRELILISQDTTFYGRDLAEGAALPALLRELNRIDGIDWIRLLYLYPTTITDDILDAMAACEGRQSASTCRCSTLHQRRSAAREAPVTGKQ